MFGINTKDLRRLAFEIAEKNKIPHQFNKNLGMAGKKWYYQFMKRHPRLSLRLPEPTSMARATGFCREKVELFFNKLTELFDNYNITADLIYNVDETGIRTVQKPMKVLALKGKHQVGGIISSERGSNGWIITDLFTLWIRHFINYVCLKLLTEHPEQKKVLLIHDGHSTHTKNLEALVLARDHGIVMLSLPSHTTHRLQPLDRSFFKALNSKYNIACNKWMRSHPGRCITQFQVSQLFGEANAKDVGMEIAIYGFRDTGIWPVDNSVFQEEDFAPSKLLIGELSSNKQQSKTFQTVSSYFLALFTNCFN